MPPTALVDPAGIDASAVLHDLEAIRRGNPRRHEMELSRPSSAWTRSAG